MMRSTTKRHSRRLRLAVICIWILLWQVLSMVLPKVLFAGPVQTVQSLLFLFPSGVFWKTTVLSLLKIMAGFLLAFVLGTLLAMFSSRCDAADAFLSPAVWIMKSVPVACFILVALIWIRTPQISVLTAFFVVFPVTYHAMLEGLSQLDVQLAEMAQVFRVPRGKYVRFAALPQVMPYVISSCKSTVGLAWKSGIAGEIIGLPDFSIGERIYLAKLYLNIADVFAWAIVMIVLSIACEKGVLWSLTKIERRVTGTG